MSFKQTNAGMVKVGSLQTLPAQSANRVQALHGIGLDRKGLPTHDAIRRRVWAMGPLGLISTDGPRMTSSRTCMCRLLRERKPNITIGLIVFTDAYLDRCCLRQCW
jgi:hypothetical protein